MKSSNAEMYIIWLVNSMILVILYFKIPSLYEIKLIAELRNQPLRPNKKSKSGSECETKYKIKKIIINTMKLSNECKLNKLLMYS
jgi:hypothetical protein